MVNGSTKIKFNKSHDVIMDLHYADSFSQTAYDANFRLMVIRCTEETNNCWALSKYSICKVNMQ